ncbi:ABC transporter substrate-binding protein [Bradyrhizobium mercantei]|uniref:ABC transporter substrate-binding protein n=1 Tax=Bradyrhizobium mercantei TaxID=1904807 RepID=UPI0013566619|nr:ABC transporter substrate-binding protein [Bradyrhizobium mercantei]
MRISRRTILAIGACALAAVANGPAEAQQAKPPIKLALITPLTGPLGSYGKIQEILVKLAVEDVNSKGGVNGSLLQLDVGDSQTDPGQAVVLFRRYAGGGYFGSIGPMTGTQWETVSPLANQIAMPSIALNAIKPGINVRPWTIRLQPPDDTQIPEGFKAFLKAFPNVKTVVITADVREASSKAAADAFKTIAQDNGLQVLDTVEFSSKSTDLSSAAIQIKSRNPDAIMVSAFPAQGMLLAKEFHTQGITAPVFNTSTLWSGPFINMVGEYGRNWYVIGFSTNADGMPGYTDQALYQSIVSRVLEKGDQAIGVPPNLANWSFGYDAILLYADIFRRNGIDGTSDPKKVRETVKDEFSKLKEFVGVYRYKFRDTGDAYLPGNILRPNVEKKVWEFMPENK